MHLAAVGERVRRNSLVFWGESPMNVITRRSLIVSGAALATGGLLTPAEAATGAIALKIFSAGFIFGVSGGSGVLSFEGQNYPLSIGGISAGATIGASGADFVGTAYHLHSCRRHPGHLFGGRGRIGGGRRPVGGPAFQRQAASSCG